MDTSGHTTGRTKLGGGNLSRQASFSHIQPRSLTQYENFFSQSSSREVGWLELKVGQRRSEGEWQRRWAVLQDGELSFSADKHELFKKSPLLQDASGIGIDQNHNQNEMDAGFRAASRLNARADALF